MDLNKNDVSIITILTENYEYFWIDYLTSILKLEEKPLEVILITQFKDKKKTQDLNKKLPSKIFKTFNIKNKKNFKFSYSNNLGSRLSKGKYLLFLNLDTKFRSNFLNVILNYHKKNNNDITGCLYNGFELNKNKTLNTKLKKYFSIDLLGYPIFSRKVFYIEGSAMLISKKIFNEIGKFDLFYDAYAEDVDLCWRAHLLNLKIGVCDFEISHYSFQKKTNIDIERRKMIEKNTLYTILKNYSKSTLFFIIPLYIFLFIAESLLLSIILRLNYFKIYISSIEHLFKNKKKLLTKRNTIQSLRKNNDDFILSLLEFDFYKYKAMLMLLNRKSNDTN